MSPPSTLRPKWRGKNGLITHPLVQIFADIFERHAIISHYELNEQIEVEFINRITPSE